MSGSMNLFIVEDNPIVRTRLQLLLSSMPLLKVIGWAEGEQDAITQVLNLLPDIVLLDLNLKNGSGINVLKAIKKNHAATKVIVLTNYSEDIYSMLCLRAGADYFFDKHYQFEAVTEVISQLLENGAVDVPGRGGVVQ